MILPLFHRRRRGDSISVLYGAIVAQARSPVFYRGYAVPNTLDGRFELILIHMALLLRRLRRETALNSIGQDVFDLFCTDMDRNLREIGISDLKVPKEMERIGAAFYGRKAAYDAALDAADDGALVEAISRNVYASSKPTVHAQRLAAYMRHVEGALEAWKGSEIERGKLRFPEA